MGKQLSHIYQDCFLHQRTSALETIHIEVEAIGLFWIEHLHDADLTATLESYLGPLKKLNGLKNVTVVSNLEEPNDCERGDMREDLFHSRRDKIFKEVQTGLDELRAAMMLPVPRDVQY